MKNGDKNMRLSVWSVYIVHSINEYTLSKDEYTLSAITLYLGDMLLKPHLSLREHLDNITQIFPHRNVDMWGCV